MNPPKAIELAMAAMIRNHANIGAGTLVRPWQSLNAEGAFDPKDDRTFPCVDVRFGSPRHNEDQVTLVCSGEILSMVYAEDDRNHQEISRIYDEVHDVVLGIFRDFQGETSNGYYTEFVAAVAQEDAGKIEIGGITMEEGMPPSDDGNALGIGVGMGVHFTYA